MNLKVRVLEEQTPSILEIIPEGFLDRLKLGFSVSPEFFLPGSPSDRSLIPKDAVGLKVVDSKGRLRGIEFGKKHVSYLKMSTESLSAPAEKWLREASIPQVSQLVHARRLLRNQIICSNFVWLMGILSLYAFFVARFVPKNYGNLDLIGAQNVQRVWILISLCILAVYPVIHYFFWRRFLKLIMARRSLAMESAILACLGLLMMVLSYDASFRWEDLYDSFVLYVRQVAE